VSVRKTDRANIDKYLKGKLDARAMHELERAAQNDPFLMDALDGFEATDTNYDANLADLKSRLADRVAPKKDRVVLLWRVLPIAGSLLLMIGGGYWFFKPDVPKPQYANVIEPKKVDKKQDTAQAVGEQAKVSAPSIVQSATPHIRKTIPSPNTQNAIVEEIIKPTDTTTLITQNKPTAKFNGKDFAGGNVQQAAKNLPADILEKVQVVDDYGAQAKKSALATNNYTLSGTITDAATKEPLTGVIVGIPGKGLTQADINGKYSVVVDSGAVYTFNLVGYISQTVKLNPGQKTLNIHLTPNNNSLAETVIRGYVKRDKEATTGSSYIITGKEVQDVPVGNVEQLVQGKVPGLNIQNNKGKPGYYGRTDKGNLAAAPQKLPDSLKTHNLAEVSIRGYVKRTREETTGSSYIITGKDQRKATERIPIGKIPGKFLPINPPASKNKAEVKCNENAAFKDLFFTDITIVEKYMLEKDEGAAGTVTYTQFFDALKFIAKRAPVSIKPNKKTRAAYADIQAFRSDRDKWLEWYENNKCNGLK
jgi:hypothetical protein